MLYVAKAYMQMDTGKFKFLFLTAVKLKCDMNISQARAN